MTIDERFDALLQLIDALYQTCDELHETCKELHIVAEEQTKQIETLTDQIEGHYARETKLRHALLGAIQGFLEALDDEKPEDQGRIQ